MSKIVLSTDEERRMLNWCVAITPIFDGAAQYGDITFTDTPNGRDLSLSSGLDNLDQQLTVALVTALGADPLNTNHGFGGYQAIAEESNPVLRREKLRFSILAVLQADPRILEVTRVLIGPEIELFKQGEVGGVAIAGAASTPDGAGDRYTTTQIEAQFTIGSGEAVSLSLAPLSGGVL